MSRFALLLLWGLVAASAPGMGQTPSVDLLNASSDTMRELFQQLNAAFQADPAGRGIDIKQSHAGSSKQARAILEGLPADVVAFNQVTDVQMLADRGFVRKDWQSAFPHGASPFYSLQVFVVRSGNPKNIRNWDDLVRPGVKVVFSNPKTSGNGRYTHLAAYAFALEAFNGDHAQAKEFIRKLVANVPVLDTGGRGATTTFAERGIGDVLVTFEAEGHGIVKEFGADRASVVVPPASILAEFPVAVVDKVAAKKGSAKAANAYLNYLYSDEAQEILALNYYRVRSEQAASRHAGRFPQVRLYTAELLGGWDSLHKAHFAEGGIFDQVFGRK